MAGRAVLVALAVLAGALAGTSRAGDVAEPERIVIVVPSGLLNIEMLVVNNGSPVPGAGGGIAVTARGVLVARALDGAVAFYDNTSDRMSVLRFRLPPTNAERLPAKSAAAHYVDPTFMRYQDIEVVERPDGLHLLVSHTRYDPDAACFSTRIEDAILPADWYEPAGPGSAPVALDWRVLIDGRPCLPFSPERNPFGGNQAGGAFAATTDGRVYVTTGDLEFDGLGAKAPAVSQLEGSTYGRVFRLDLDAGTATEIARGLRNPQGLTVDAAGRLWATDHGAMGGDELDAIAPGLDYGWPSVTLGVNYVDLGSDAKFWPLNPVQGRHDGYEPPRFAWIPSIAPSSITAVAGFHPRWDGDLLVSTLVGQALHRLRMDGDRVLYDERIDLQQRVRAVQSWGGRLYILFDDGRLAIASPRVMGEPQR